MFNINIAPSKQGNTAYVTISQVKKPKVKEIKKNGIYYPKKDVTHSVHLSEKECKDLIKMLSKLIKFTGDINEL